MTTTLTDRYLYAATRSVPEAQREELRRELAERIGDDIDARIEDGADHATAETAALTALGDPDALAASYLDRVQHLIGPTLYPLWRRLLRLLLIIVVPVVAVAFPLAQTLAHKPFGEIVGSTFVVLIALVIHLGFWTTLVFAVLERNLRGKPLMEWTPALLPELHEPTRTTTRWDAAVNLSFIALGAVAILTLTPLQPFQSAEQPATLIEPATWAWLGWYLLGMLAVDVVFWAVLLRAGRWTWPLTAACTVITIAFAAPVVWALATGRLFNPDYLAATAGVEFADQLAAGGVLAIVFAYAAVGVAAIWPIDAAIKTWRATHD
ncbi:MAG TPA: permease prefix domain 1-containing protein [Terrimesophilobacter sp.]|nr:permease prefix domain 1-containing protein [Terrimesophilobacter sp.]